MRLFIGMPVPASPEYNRTTHALRQVTSDAKPVPAGTWHVTLRFLGEVKDPRLVEDALQKALAGHHAMPVKVAGLGAFQGPTRARVVWAKAHADGLRNLAMDVIEATKDMGDPPAKDWASHVTLARLKAPRDLSDFIAAHKETPLAEGVLDRVVLYRSTLTKSGPVYQRLLEVPLQRSAQT